MASIEIEIADGVAEITLADPARYNALDRTMLDALIAALAQAESDPDVRAVLLTGAGKGFCSGANIAGDILDRVTSMEDRMRQGINRVIAAMRQSPLPIVVAVNGAAAGGGVGLALAGDIVFAAHSAYFFLSFVKVGLSLDCGASLFVQRAVGAARARALALLGEKLSAQDAERWGLIWRAVADEALLDDARACARKLAEGPPLAIAWIKTTLDAGWNGNLDDGLEREILTQAQAFLTQDLQEGVKAFREKRSPVFHGA